MFNQYAQRMVEAERTFQTLVASCNDPHHRERYARDVDNAEHAADRVTLHVNADDQEQIHNLINTTDDVADQIKAPAENVALCGIRRTAWEMTRLADISVKCCERFRRRDRLLSQFADVFEGSVNAKVLCSVNQTPGYRPMRNGTDSLY